MLLKCSKSPMIIYYNNQKPFFMGLWGRGLSAELIECISSTFTLQSSGTMAVCHCYFLHIFPKIKSCFPGILDRFFFFFQMNSSCNFRMSQPIETVVHEKLASQFKLFLKNHFFPIQHHSRQCHIRHWKSPLCFLYVFTSTLWQKRVKF